MSARCPRAPEVRVLPGDPRYATMVRGFNLRWAGRPRYVALPADTAGVARAVQDALDAGLRITVKSGGHGYEDFAVANDGGVILDLSTLRAVYRDPDTGWICVEPGAALWDVYLRLYKEHGVMLPAGTCAAVGAGGHVIGGGYGLSSRRLGLTVDHLHAVELVHVTERRRAEVILARRDAPDAAERALLWAHQGGGGGNFGIVTRLWFERLPAAPSDAWVVDLAWDWEGLRRADFGRIVRAFGDFCAAHGAADSPYVGLSTYLELRHRSAGQIRLGGVYEGDDPSLVDAFLRHMVAATCPRAGRRRAPALHVSCRRLPWLFAVQTLDENGPNQRGKYKSAYMIEPFPDGQIDVLWDHLGRGAYRNPQAALGVSAYGGRINAVDPAATAVPQRSSILKLQYATLWQDEAADAEHLAWIRGFYRAMYGERGPYPDGTFDGCYVNYPDVDLVDWQTLYYKDNYPRLRAVKGRWDPLDVFHHAQSIELPVLALSALACLRARARSLKRSASAPAPGLPRETT